MKKTITEPIRVTKKTADYLRRFASKTGRTIGGAASVIIDEHAKKTERKNKGGMKKCSNNQ